MAYSYSLTEENAKKLHLTHVKNENYVNAADHDINPRTEMIIIDDPPTFDSYRQINHWNIENRRIIELSDYKTKMELHREFRLDEIHKLGNTTSNVQSYGAIRNVMKISNSICGNEEILLPKLPAGTILIKHNTNCSNTNELSKQSLMTEQTMITEKLIQSNIEKIELIHPPEKPNRNIHIRRNPIRRTKKKLDDSFTRRRLLAIKKRGNNDDHLVHVVEKKQMKSSNVPYMNTRSVTKKMYNVGATHQAPTAKDEIEWREWPMHDMHERPIYHPQMGLAVEYIGHNFISVDGSSYQKVSQSSKTEVTSMYLEPQQINTYTRNKTKNQYSKRRNVGDSFENCMHESLHSVLAYSAQITVPQYKKLIDKHKNVNDEKATEQDIELACSQESKVNRSVDPLKLQITKPPLNLKCIKNHAKLQRVLERGSKNTLILLKTTDPALKKESHCVVSAPNILSNTLIPVKVESDVDIDHIVLKQTSSFNQLAVDDLSQDRSDIVNNSTININDGMLLMSQSNIQNDDDKNDLPKENWLHELISDTVMLYCTAVGTHQKDFVAYLNSLDAKQCMNWIDSGY